MTQTWPYPGARWWKFDFHTHTPASTDTPWYRLIGTPDELTPEAWLLQYMAAEVDCVAITDHNSGEWVDKLKTAYAAMHQQAQVGHAPAGFRALHLFPGVEISVQGGFHLLAIFDPSASSQTISEVLAAVEYDGMRGDSNGVTRKGAAEVVAKVRDAGGLAIPSHVDADNGLLQTEPGTRKTRLNANTVRQVLQEPGLVALEWLDVTQPGPAVLDEVKRPFAQVLGSDCHSFRGAAVPGSRYTWVKMATPSLEGLRLALLDGQGVSVRRSDDEDGFAPLAVPEHFIESVEIRQAKWMGLGKSPALLKMSPYLNALVGGRGTGKSTVVHALRLAYRRSAELVKGSDAAVTFENFVNPPKGKSGGLRAETAIAVRVHRDGTSYRLLWRQEGQGPVVEVWDTAARQFKPATSQAITPQRFPIRLFSQGQIAALAGDSQQALLQVIDDAADTQTPLNALAEAKRAFMATRAQMREWDGKLGGREALTLGLQDVQRKLARFEGADHAAVLTAYQKTSRQVREMERQFEQAADVATRLHALAGDVLAEDLPEGLFAPEGASSGAAVDAVKQLHVAISDACMALEHAAHQLQSRQQQIRSGLDASDWARHVGNTQSAYHQLKADLQQQGVNDPSEYGRLVQERQRLETEIQRLHALQQQRDALKTRALAQLEAVYAARRAVSECRQRFLQTTLNNNPFVRIALIPYGRDPRIIDRALRELLGATEDKYRDDVWVEGQDDVSDKGAVADLLLAVSLDERAGEWNGALFESSLKQLKKRLVLACQGRGDFGSWFNKFLKTESDKRPEFVDHIRCWFPEDGLRVECSRKGDGRDFQPIGQASAGQRAAAMLAFLLAHGNEPLVLDQPEDDLDNHLIYDLVVQQIRANKMRRQLIIVTHNPNIVVNGDAEWIQVMDFNHQCFVKQSGSLQDPRMRAEVCQVMEGGQEAFERRYQRLGQEV